MRVLTGSHLLKIIAIALGTAIASAIALAQPPNPATVEPPLFEFRPPPANEPAKLKAARADLHAAFKIAPNEPLRVVVPPFPTARDAFFSVRGQSPRIPQQICWLLNDKSVEEAFGSFGSDHEEADHDLLNIVAGTLRLRRSQIEGPARDLLDKKLRLDVILLAGTTRLQAVEPLARGIRDKAHIPVKFSLVTVKRDAWIMRGKFKDDQIGASDFNPLIIFGKNPPPLGDGSHETTRLQGGGVDHLADRLSEYLGREVIVDNVEPPKPRAMIHFATWRFRRADPGTEDDVIQQFTKDTGLTFKREPREIQVLVVDHAR